MVFTRITIDPRRMGGVPSIRHLRIPVATVIDMVADGMTEPEILAAYPDLEAEDIREALHFAGGSRSRTRAPYPVELTHFLGDQALSLLSQRSCEADAACLRYTDPMNVELTPDQRAFVRDAMAQGRVLSEEQAVQQALALWEARERRRAEILADVAEAEAALAAGQGRPITEESMRALADEVKRRGRERLSLETAG